MKADLAEILVDCKVQCDKQRQTITAMQERIRELEAIVDSPKYRLDTQRRANDRLLKELDIVKEQNLELDMLLNMYQKRVLI